MAGNLSLTRTYNRIFSIMRDEAIEPYLWDNVSARTAYLYAMKAKGAIKEIGGKEHLSYKILKELPVTEGYTDDGVLTPVRADPYTRAIYEWKQLACPVQVTGLDMIKTGEGAEPDLLEAFIQAAEISMRDAIGGSSIGVFSSADEDTLTSITGLQSILGSSTTTGTVGRLSRATLSVWRHISGNVASAFDTNGLNIMTTLYRQCTRADESPDLFVVNGSTWDNFLRETTRTFQTHVPFMMGDPDQAMVEVGFPNVRFFGATLFPDDGVTANVGYAINSKYINILVREGRNAELGDFVKSANRDDLVAYVFWAGNQICKGLRYNGVLLNADTY